MEQPKSTIKSRMNDIHVGGLPLWLYLLALVLLAAALWMDCLPRNIVGAFFLLMILGDGLNYLGNTIPIVKTYLGGSVICIFGGAILAAAGVFHQSAMETMDAFVNDEGFLVLYISALITGSLFSIDRNLLLQGAVRILPVSLTALLVGFLVCGGIGAVSGNGFWNNILYVAVPMTSGGMTAGTVPLSQVYAAQLGQNAGDILTRIAPATVLGNCIAIIYASLADNLGRKHPALSGGGRLVNDGTPAHAPRTMNITLEKMVVGLLAALGFYCLGTVGHSLVKPIPIYGWMILLVMVVKCLGWMPAEVEDAACQWGQFVIKAWTAAALFGIGVTLIDLNTIAQNMTPLYLLTILVVETVIVLTASLIGWKAAHFYPVEAAIAAGMCTTNMGGSGNVAVLSSAHRMELMPFAQIVTRSCGALILTLGGVLIQFVG